MITEKDVNEAYDAFEKSFADLAKIEDRQTKCLENMNNAREGSKAETDAKARLAKIQPEMTEAQRAFRMAGMKVDRIRLLLDVEKNAKGRD